MDDIRSRSEPSDSGPRQRPWDRSVVAPLDAAGGFSAQEHWAWARIIRGYVANMSLFDPNAAPNSQQWFDGKSDEKGENSRETGAWPGHRALSGRFLRTILFHEPWASARDRPFVYIEAAHLVDEIDWMNERLPSAVSFHNCLFERDIVLMSLQAKVLAFSGSVCKGGVKADSINVDGDLYFRENFKVTGDLLLPGARVGGDIVASGADIGGRFSVESAKLEGSVFLDSGAKVAGRVSVVGARVGGMVGLRGLEVGGDLHLDRALIDGSLFMNEKCEVKGQTHVSGTHIGRNLNARDATFHKGVHAENVIVGGDCFLRESKFGGPVTMLGASINQDLQLSRSDFASVVDLTSAVVRGELSLAQVVGGEPTWGDNAKLVLRNARVGALAGSISAFKRKKGFVPSDLAGFAFDRLGGIGAGEKEGSTLARASSRDLRRWLSSCCPANSGFEPEPFRQVAKALREAGRADKADEVLHELGNHERSARGTPFWRKHLFLPLSDLLIGYGYRNHRAIVWFLILIAAATGIGLYTDLRFAPAGPSGWEDVRAWLDWSGFTFGAAIPVVVLDPAHETFLAERFCLVENVDGVCTQSAVPEGLQGFYYGVKLAGLLVLSYLAAGLTGLAQRRN